MKKSLSEPIDTSKSLKPGFCASRIDLLKYILLSKDRLLFCACFYLSPHSRQAISAYILNTREADAPVLGSVLAIYFLLGLRIKFLNTVVHSECTQIADAEVQCLAFKILSRRHSLVGYV